MIHVPHPTTCSCRYDVATSALAVPCSDACIAAYQQRLADKRADHGSRQPPKAYLRQIGAARRSR